LDDLGEGKAKKYGLETASEDEVKWRMQDIRLQSRQHGFILDKADVFELGHLNFYHNSLSRGPLQYTHPLPIVHPVLPSRQMKDLGGDLATTSQSLPSLSHEVAMGLLPGPPLQRNFHNLGLEQDPPSIERLMEMAGSVMHSSANELQLRCQAAGICTFTASKLNGQRSRPLSGGSFDDDPLFSGRLGSTPRTSTGKPLPMPFWGKNGSAPVLREHPELRQARGSSPRDL
jgi:hypothetical protein